MSEWTEYEITFPPMTLRREDEIIPWAEIDQVLLAGHVKEKTTRNIVVRRYPW
jgi:hypothetical protein